MSNDDIEFVDSNPYKQEFDYRDFKIVVSRDYDGADVIVNLSDPNDIYRSSCLRLQQLLHEDFNDGDFFQQAFNSNPSGEGLGSLIHDFLIEKKDEIEIEFVNIYSTNPNVDVDLTLSNAANQFW